MSAATEPRWYVLNAMDMVTLCAGKEDAEAVAAEYDLQYPLRAPHRAVQLVVVVEADLDAELDRLKDAYCGAREDLAIWKRRALETEEKLRAESGASSRLVSELNSQNGPTHMGEPAPLVVSMSDVDQAQLAAMLANRQPMPLVVAPDGSELAACFDQIKSELIADGAVEHDLGLEFFPEAVLDAFRRQRAARIEAQQRLADAQELAAKSGLAHRKAVQAAVAEAVAAEREACAALVAEWNTAMTDNLAAEIRARGAA